MITLGDTVTDCVTGFKGIALERVETLAGGTYYGIQAKAEDNVIPEPIYIEEERLIGSLKDLRMVQSGKTEQE